MPYDATVIKRFWANVSICIHGTDCPYCCWPWIGTSALGYGVLSVYDTDRYRQTGSGAKNLKSNRLAIEIHDNALIPLGLMALHHCNNPPCCNRDHLYKGTAKDNAHDMIRSRRHVSMVKPASIVRGERHHNWKGGITKKWGTRLGGRYKFSVDAIRQIRHLAFAGFPVKVIAKIFGASHGHISEVIARKKRREVV